jgi:hypothetical protein
VAFFAATNRPSAHRKMDTGKLLKSIRSAHPRAHSGRYEIEYMTVCREEQ